MLKVQTLCCALMGAFLAAGLVRANTVVTTTGTVAYSSVTVSSTDLINQGQSSFGSAAATLTWNLYQGGLTRAQEQEARAALQGIDAQVAALRQQVRLEVEQARLAVRAGKAALEAAGEALLNARQRLRLAEGRYQTGSGSAIEQGDAQLALTAAAAQKVTADYNLATSRAQLLRALGREPEGAVR
jgi:outer membrane protein TolC